MKKVLSFFKKQIVLLTCVAIILPFFACGETPMPGSAGKYYNVYERQPFYTVENADYVMTLDGYGKGEYYHKGNNHKIKYDYKSNGDIKINDLTTGINYQGTLIDGELHMWDGDPNDPSVSEFLFEAK